jgi:hypothetical protein
MTCLTGSVSLFKKAYGHFVSCLALNSTNKVALFINENGIMPISFNLELHARPPRHCTPEIKNKGHLYQCISLPFFTLKWAFMKQ